MSKINQKGFAVVFWLVITLIFAGVLLWLYSMKAKTPATLLTPSTGKPDSGVEETNYSEPNLKFKFSYPSKYKLVEDSEQSYIKRGNTDFRKNFTSYVGYAPPDPISAITLQDPSQSAPDSFDKAPFLIWVFDNPDELSAKVWYNRYWYYPFMWGVFSSDQKSQNAPKQESSISGQLGLGGSVAYQELSPDYIYIPFRKKMYLLRILNTLDKDSKEKILTSLRLP